MAATRDIPRLQKTFREEVIPKVMKEFGLKNPNQVPKVAKIIVSTGVGKRLENQKLKPEHREAVVDTQLQTELAHVPILIEEPVLEVPKSERVARERQLLADWGGGCHQKFGATVIEREDYGPVTVRSALDLLGTAYTVHPAFGEGEIVEMSAGVRPSLPSGMGCRRLLGGEGVLDGLGRGIKLGALVAQPQPIEQHGRRQHQ